jgi:hypothetical protein
MDVIRHDDIAANGNVVPLCTFAKGTEGFLDLSTCEQMPSRMCIEGDEVEWPNGGEKQFKPSRTFWEIGAVAAALGRRVLGYGSWYHGRRLDRARRLQCSRYSRVEQPGNAKV